MIKASIARLNKKEQHLGPLGNVKQVIEAKTNVIEMFFTSPGLRIQMRGRAVVIPYSNFEYIIEAPNQGYAEEKAPTNAERIAGAAKLPDSRLQGSNQEQPTLQLEEVGCDETPKRKATRKEKE